MKIFKCCERVFKGLVPKRLLELEFKISFQFAGIEFKQLANDPQYQIPHQISYEIVRPIKFLTITSMTAPS